LNLTEVEFWEKYWEGVKLPSQVDMGFSFDRCLSQALADYLPNKGEVLEVGCAPGKWLAFAATKSGLQPSGIEYSQGGIAATKRNFQMLNISYGSLIAADFFNTTPDNHYDVVMSFGFIEHFDDVDDVVLRHLSWLKPGGTLILGVPNFSGVSRCIQSIFDQDILDKHNLEIMNLSYFEKLGVKLGIEKVAIKYLGSFEPALFIPKHRIGNPLQFLLRCVLFGIRLLRKLRFTDKFNGSRFSSYILAVYKK
jgi:SAM-dependent methyltransferase